jgi:hypothetical protein
MRYTRIMAAHAGITEFRGVDKIRVRGYRL